MGGGEEGKGAGEGGAISYPLTTPNNIYICAIHLRKLLVSGGDLFRLFSFFPPPPKKKATSETLDVIGFQVCMRMLSILLIMVPLAS